MRSHHVAFAIGALLCAIAIVKFSFIGFSSSEAVAFGIIGALGAAALFTGTHLMDRET